MNLAFPERTPRSQSRRHNRESQDCAPMPILAHFPLPRRLGCPFDKVHNIGPFMSWNNDSFSCVKLSNSRLSPFSWRNEIPRIGDLNQSRGDQFQRLESGRNQLADGLEFIWDEEYQRINLEDNQEITLCNAELSVIDDQRLECCASRNPEQFPRTCAELIDGLEMVDHRRTVC
jgi:hypothetical protein